MIAVDSLEQSDITIIVNAFAVINWSKPSSIFDTYLKEQEAGQRKVWVAYLNDQFAGYITLKWQSQYKSFADQNIPEIMDLNVLPNYRRQGVGSRLLEIAEKEAISKNNIVGIGVGLYGGSDGGYGMAQKLYVSRGYIPDGRGVTYNYQPATAGEFFRLDDDLVLWFTKVFKERRG